jgi:hypothetical protein
LKTVTVRRKARACGSGVKNLGPALSVAATKTIDVLKNKEAREASSKGLVIT